MRKEELDAISRRILDAAFRIHTQIGPGCLESVYEVLLAHDLSSQGLVVERQKRIAAVINGIQFDLVFVADLIVADCIVVELKAVEKMAPVFERQLATQLKLLDYRLGLLINFGAEHLKDGIKRVVNGI